MEKLIQERIDLVIESDDGGAFPGSREWLRANAVAAKLAAFDAAHPEVLAHCRAEHRARMLDSAVGRGND